MTQRRRRCFVTAFAAGLALGHVGQGWACVPLRSVLTVLPQPSGAPGSKVDVVGIGFNEGERVEVRWNALDGPQLAGATGPDFTASVTIPTASEGLYSLVAVSRDVNGVVGTSGTTVFLVTGDGPRTTATNGDSASAPSGPPASRSPAEIGLSPTPAYIWVGVAFALLLFGGAVAVRRDRRSARAQAQAA